MSRTCGSMSPVAAHDDERGVDQPPDLGRVLRPAARPPPGRRARVQSTGTTFCTPEHYSDAPGDDPYHPTGVGGVDYATSARSSSAVSAGWRRSTIRVRWIWPVAAVRGSASTTATRRGCLNGGEPAGAERAERVDVGRGARRARPRRPRSRSRPTRRRARRPPRPRRRRDARPSTASTSGGATVSPPVRITSRARPTIER